MYTIDDYNKPEKQEKKTSNSEKTPSKKGLINAFSNMELKIVKGKITFLIIFLLMGLGAILMGDLFRLIALKVAGTSLHIVGWILIAVSFFVPLGVIIDENS